MHSIEFGNLCKLTALASEPTVLFIGRFLYHQGKKKMCRTHNHIGLHFISSVLTYNKKE